MSVVIPKDLTPPPFRRLSRRLQVSKRREPKEEDLKRSSKGIICSRCGKMGHNKRTCQGGTWDLAGQEEGRRFTRHLEEQIDSDKLLASYMHRTQRRRRN